MDKSRWKIIVFIFGQYAFLCDRFAQSLSLLSLSRLELCLWIGALLLIELSVVGADYCVLEYKLDT